MSELRILTISTLVLLLIGGLVPTLISSFVDTENIQLTGTRLNVYNILSSGVDLTGSFDVPTDDSFYDYLAGVEIMTDNFPIIFNALIFIYLFILLYTIVKALPFT